MAIDSTLSPARPSLARLPAELVVRVAKELEPADVARLGATSRKLHSDTSDGALWDRPLRDGFRRESDSPREAYSLLARLDLNLNRTRAAESSLWFASRSRGLGAIAETTFDVAFGAGRLAFATTGLSGAMAGGIAGTVAALPLGPLFPIGSYLGVMGGILAGVAVAVPVGTAVIAANVPLGLGVGFVGHLIQGPATARAESKLAALKNERPSLEAGLAEIGAAVVPRA